MSEREPLSKYADCYAKIRETEGDIVGLGEEIDTKTALEIGLVYCTNELSRSTEGYRQTKEEYYRLQTLKASGALNVVLQSGITEQLKLYLTELGFFQEEMSKLTQNEEFHNLSKSTIQLAARIPNYVDKQVANYIVASELKI